MTAQAAIPLAAALTPQQRDTLAQALGDALSWRQPDTCRDCTSGLLCDDHRRDVQLRARYRVLADELGLIPETD